MRNNFSVASSKWTYSNNMNFNINSLSKNFITSVVENIVLTSASNPISTKTEEITLFLQSWLSFVHFSFEDILISSRICCKRFPTVHQAFDAATENSSTILFPVFAFSVASNNFFFHWIKSFYLLFSHLKIINYTGLYSITHSWFILVDTGKHISSRVASWILFIAVLFNIRF